MGPPSSLASRLIELTEEEGDGRVDKAAEDALLVLSKVPLALMLVLLVLAPSSFNLRAALVKVTLFPLPNLLHTWPGFVRCLLI
jgi:hypothetical protein